MFNVTAALHTLPRGALTRLRKRTSTLRKHKILVLLMGRLKRVCARVTVAISDSERTNMNCKENTNGSMYWFSNINWEWPATESIEPLIAICRPLLDSMIWKMNSCLLVCICMGKNSALSSHVPLGRHVTPLWSRSGVPLWRKLLLPDF